MLLFELFIHGDSSQKEKGRREGEGNEERRKGGKKGEGRRHWGKEEMDRIYFGKFSLLQVKTDINIFKNINLQKIFITVGYNQQKKWRPNFLDLTSPRGVDPLCLTCTCPPHLAQVILGAHWLHVP